MTTQILVGVDGSYDSMAALRWANSFATRERAIGKDATVTALKSWQPPTTFGTDVFGVTPESFWQERAERVLVETIERAGATETCTTVVRRGPAAAALLAEAEALDADLIVAGVRSGRTIEKFVLGSVSRRLAANGKRPVAIVPLDAPNFGAPTVVGFDDSDGARSALRWAVDHCEGEIRPMMAWRLPNTFGTEGICVDTNVFESGANERLINGVRTTLDSPTERVVPVLRYDDARTMLTRPGDAAQIVMGSHRHRGMVDFLLGSVTAFVATHCATAVVIVPPSA